MDCEKENINVVIVPENILQAIRNSSNLNVDITDTVSIASIQQKEDNGTVQDGINLQTLQNGNLWFMLSGENLEINAPSSVVDGSVSDNSSVMSFEKPVESRDGAVPNSELGTVSNSGSSRIVLYQNCSFRPQRNSGNLLSINKDIIQAHDKSDTAVSLQRITSCNENINNALTSSEVNESFFNVNLSSFQTGTETSIGQEMIKTNVSYVNDPASIVNPPLISHQEIVKNSILTADKGTCTYGTSKALHKCDFENCNQTFKSALECRNHKTTVHGKEKSYKCKYANCLWSFSTPYKLRRHLESHYKRKPYACTYPGCNAVFSSDYNQRAHAKQHYTVNPSRICKVCGEVADNKRKLTAHMRDVHNEIPDFVCSICKKNFQTLAALVIHRRSHNPPIDYTCPVCEKKFTKLYYLKIHLYTHTGEKPFKCEQCDCGFASLSRLNRHMWIHKEDRRFICTEESCEKKFYRLNHLLQHMRKKHQIEPCSDNSVLQMYMNKGGEEASFFQCEACGLRCLTSHGLERHKLKCEEHAKHVMEKGEPILRSDSGNEDEVADLDNDLQVGRGENIIVEINNFVDDMSKDDEHSPSVPDGKSTPSEKLLDSHNVEFGPTRPVAQSSTHGTSSDIASGLQKDWNPSLLAQSNLPENLEPSQYLACSSNNSNSQVAMVPFINDMNVLSDSATRHFLQLNDDLTVCVNPVSADTNSVNSSDENDVLKQYVVSSRDQKSTSISGKRNCLNSYKRDTSIQGVSTCLFDDDVSLTSIDDDANQRRQFPGTTININDIH